MKQDRSKLEENLDVIIEDYSGDNKVIEQVVTKLLEKGIPRGRTTGVFTKAIPLTFFSENELCLFTKNLFGYIHNNHKSEINPVDYFTDIELSFAESYEKLESEKVTQILLHNVFYMGNGQYICPIETYQNVGIFIGNGLLNHNPNTQRQRLKRKVGNRIIESINIIPDKVSEISELMLNGIFSPNIITWNVRKINGQEKIKYDVKNRTLLIEPDNLTTFIDICDGLHRTGGMLKCIEINPNINRVTSIYIHHVTEERANQIIRQESKSTPISKEWSDLKDSSNVNMETAKSINEQQRKNEMFNRIGLEDELKLENKLVTFDVLSKSIEFVYDLKNKPIMESGIVQKHLVDVFNICIGNFYELFKEDNLEDTRKNYYLTDNMFMGYVILGELLKQKHGDDWKEELVKVLNSLDFLKSNAIWKKIGIENLLNKSTYDKFFNYFNEIVSQKGVK